MTPNDLVIVYKLRRKHTYKRAQVQRIRSEVRAIRFVWFCLGLGVAIFLFMRVFR